MATGSDITLICPALNEASGIGFFLQQLDQTLAALPETFRFRVVVVDDGSTDNTGEQVMLYQPQSFTLTLCQLTRNFGKEAAIQAGLERYHADAVILLDTDLQHPLSLIPQMLEHWQLGVLVVEAVKSHRGDESRWYSWASGLFYKSMKSTSGLTLENQSDYKLLDATVIQTLLALPERIRFFRGLVQWMGFKSVTLPFEVQERHIGDSSWNGLHLLRYSIRNITAFSSIPLYLITIIGLLMLVFSTVLGAHVLYQWAIGTAVTGFTTVILLLLLIGSLLLISLGIIGLYIARIYEEVKSRPLYLVAKEWHS
ncbi:glycosyltransferase family 2 protein [Oceanospirillum maris]|uniref:glycosyltransferase family 2 protein n=1 Tax=Oceanospirillum maris TaxID=64977 RepID=UPI0003F97B68|nr:glycosyltransferase family 2 protein [Oceanospirillum maris]